jgi:DNA-directed RNA polymerase specialized sigma24 family protein
MSKKCEFAAAGTAAIFAYYNSGDEELLTPVLAELRLSLLIYSEQKLNIYDASQRDDLVQETLEHILHQLRSKKFRGAEGQYGERVGILTWAKLLCRYRFLEGLRSMKDKPSEPGRDENPFLLLADMSEESDVETLSYLPQAEAVLTAATEAVLDLDPKLSEVLVLIFFRSLSPQQAANQMGVRIITLRSRLEAGLRELRYWAARQQLKPTGEVYRALRHLDTGDLFQESYAPPAALRLAS